MAEKANTSEGTDTRFKNKYGVYVVESEVQKANSSMSIRGKCSLGRPWVSVTEIERKDLTRPELQAPLNIHQNTPRRLDPLLGIHKLERKG
jgi:hypothetical protein